MDTTSDNLAVESQLLHARELFQSRQYSDALTVATALAEQVPENRDVLYLVAQCQRFGNDIDRALQTLVRLETLHPRFSRLYEERGQCLVSRRDATNAIDAFLRAVNINPALPASWKMLEGLYRLTHNEADRATAAQHVETLAALPIDVVRATSHFSDDDHALAEVIIRAYLAREPNDVEALRLLARIALERGVLDDAEAILASVLETAPDYRAARHDYARALIERHKYRAAREQLNRLLIDEPTHLHYRALRAAACVGLGDHEHAVEQYRGLIEEAPDAADVHLSLAHSLKTLGRRDEAIASYRRAAELRPDFGDASWSLANLKTYRFSESEILKMRQAAEATATSVPDRYHFCFALGKAHEDRGEYEESWRWYARGNAEKRAESRYRPEIQETNTREQIATCTQEFFARHAHAGNPSRTPIFIVGLPRAGSTLLEQILASHRDVEGTQELADVPRLVLQLQGPDPDLDRPRYPANLAQLDDADFTKFGADYLRDTEVYRSGKPHFIDKMPNNFRHVGLIRLMLPNAKIIDARREPMACCFSNLKQLFAVGQEFAYSIDDIARYYRTYVELMRHWDDVLPGHVLRVQHEDVVDDLDGSVRRILDFCELDFQPQCLDFYRNARSVRTASSEQVRMPIFREGLEQWKNYAPWLGELAEKLGCLTR